MELLYEKALKFGFCTHDGVEEKDVAMYFMCTECSVRFLTELRQWFIEDHSLFVQEQCFNTYNWGFRIYELTGGTELGAPIIYEEDSAEHVSNTEALTYGLLEAFEHISR